MGRFIEVIMEVYNRFCEALTHSMKLLNLLGFRKLNLALYRMNQNDDFLTKQIRWGCNISNTNYMWETPLHIAVTRSTVLVAYELIKNGANIDSQDRSGRTPLRHAIQQDNLEAVCLLLYYGADVNVVCKQSMTPLIYSVYAFRLNIAWILADFYDNYSNQKCYRITMLHLAVAHHVDLAIRLLNNGVDVNCVTPCGRSLLEFSLCHSSGELFKIIFKKMDNEVLLKSSSSFLLKYVNECSFTSLEWLECMYLLLESPKAASLVQACNDWMDQQHISDLTFFQSLSRAFHSKNIEHKDRVAIIYICLSLGAQVNIYDTINMYEQFGFNEEVEVLMDATIIVNCYGEVLPLVDGYNISIAAFILSINRDLSTRYILNSIIDQNDNISEKRKLLLTFLLQYFSVPVYVKTELLKFIQAETVLQEYSQEILAKLSKVPEFPSLFELSRGQARKFIKQTFNIKKPSEFHNIVKSLKVPEKIKNIIRFKEGIYE